MSSINFESVCTDYPELSRAAHSISDWVKNHRAHSYVAMPTLMRELSGQVAWKDMVRVLAQLESKGLLKVRFRVQLPDGTLSDDEFESPDEISPCVFDSAFQPVEVRADMIVPVYVVDDHQ